MGKNKGQKTKSKEKAFTVIQAAKKSKTKEVKTNLKKVENFLQAEQNIMLTFPRNVDPLTPHFLAQRHLLIACCGIGIQLSVRLSVILSVRQQFALNKILKCLSVPMIARIMKACIVIVLDILYKHAP